METADSALFCGVGDVDDESAESSSEAEDAETVVDDLLRA